jgi:DnaK suppressor protein
MDTTHVQIRQQLEAQLDHPGRLEVAAIRFALARLENGTYTECCKCGKEIDARRLVAFPTTTTCLPCSI